MKLETLFQGIAFRQSWNWDPHRSVRAITSDSRIIQEGSVFVACHGTRMNGHDFIGQAIHSKASVIVFEKEPDFVIPKHVTAVQVESSSACLSKLLLNFYGHPDQDVKLVGITGTNGKTTTAYLLQKLLAEKSSASYIGTLWYQMPTRMISSANTTPGAEVLIPLLADMKREQVQYSVMEVSSHALHQRRVSGLQFEVAIFTHLTQDHLDYHKDLEEYFQAKKLLFTQQPKPRKSLINADCPYGRRLLKEIPELRSFGIHHAADYRVEEMETSFQGSRFIFSFKGRKVPFQIRLPMPHNVSNVAAVLASLDLLGFDPEDFRGSLQEFSGIPGRLERVAGSADFQVFVDYAHTPDAFENVLSESRKLRPRKILTLFGCGGDRDRLKRPLMTEIACRYSDIVILTTDNPRSEDPEVIFRDMKQGIDPARHSCQIQEIYDRREAIEKMVSLAEPGDVLLVLGKGHEDYQILGDRKVPFDDRQVVAEALEKRKSRVFLQ